MEDQLEQIAAGDVPEWTGPTLPDSAKIIMLVDEENFDFGGTLTAAYRLALDRVALNNLHAGNTAVLFSEDADISVASGTVVPAYVETFDPHLTRRAQANSETTKARFLILGRSQNVDDSYDIQTTGYYNFDAPHIYQVGQTYYLSDSSAGGVTTEPPVSAIVQPLFTVLTPTLIQIAVGP